MMDKRARFLKAALCDLSTVEVTSQGYELVLPQAYHTGNAVAVVVQNEATGFYVHDNGYAAMLLEGLGVRPTHALQSHLHSSVEAYGCDLAGFRVFRRCSDWAEVAFAAITVGCASRLIADHALRVDAPPVFDFKRALLGKVEESIGISRIRENQEYRADKGTSYKVTAVILDARESKPVAFLEPISRHQAVARKFREFYDFMLTPSLVDIERVAVYDDSQSEITSGDILLLQDVSNPVRFRDSGKRFHNWQRLH